jgi:Mycothiol maleylpyruvate isomerase N-terminal domain
MTRPSNPFDPPQHDEELLVILARLDAEAPDPGVRSALMAAVAGSPRPALTGMAPLDVFAGCAEDLAELLDELTADEGEGAVSAYDWTVRELIAHLAAVEDHMSVTLGFAPGRDPRSDPDHLSHLAFAPVPDPGRTRW